MAYKDREKQREANREAQRRRRQSQAAIAEKSLNSIEKKFIPPPEAKHPFTGKHYDKEGEPVLDEPRNEPVKASPRPQPILDSVPVMYKDTIRPSELDDAAFSIEDEIAARVLVNRSMEIIDRKGFVLWKCKNLNNDLIVIIKDKKTAGYPLGYPVYTLGELEELNDKPMATQRLIHAIKLAGVQDNLPGFAEIIPKNER